MKKPRVPPERRATARARIVEALEDGDPLTLRELSVLVGLSEKQLPQHLEHIGRSLRRQGRRLVVEPPECGACGFVFEGRSRFTRPGKCPECRSTRITPPAVRLDPPRRLNPPAEE